LAAMPGNVFVPAIASGLPRDSVVNVTALVTLDKTDLDPAVGQLPASLMHEVDRGLRRVLGLLNDTLSTHTEPRQNQLRRAHSGGYRAPRPGPPTPSVTGADLPCLCADQGTTASMAKASSPPGGPEALLRGQRTVPG
jgi:hypothetical protein